MECGTIHCDLDDACTILSRTEPCAYKFHKCNECRREIRSGENYLKEVTVFDGKI